MKQHQVMDIDLVDFEEFVEMLKNPKSYFNDIQTTCANWNKVSMVSLRIHITSSWQYSLSSKRLAFYQCRLDSWVYYNEQNKSFMGSHVDDFIIMAPPNLIEKQKQEIKSIFEVKDKGFITRYCVLIKRTRSTNWRKWWRWILILKCQKRL